jgi:hypothetical protein
LIAYAYFRRSILNSHCLIILTASDSPIHLGRTPLDECAGVQLQCTECDPFPSGRFEALEDTTFVAVIGPAANPRGYTAITGE